MYPDVQNERALCGAKKNQFEFDMFVGILCLTESDSQLLFVYFYFIDISTVFVIYGCLIMTICF